FALLALLQKFFRTSCILFSETPVVIKTSQSFISSIFSLLMSVGLSVILEQVFSLQSSQCLFLSVLLLNLALQLAQIWARNSLRMCDLDLRQLQKLEIEGYIRSAYLRSRIFLK